MYRFDIPKPLYNQNERCIAQLAERHPLDASYIFPFFCQKNKIKTTGRSSKYFFVRIMVFLCLTTDIQKTYSKKKCFYFSRLGFDSLYTDMSGVFITTRLFLFQFYSWSRWGFSTLVDCKVSIPILSGARHSYGHLLYIERTGYL